MPFQKMLDDTLASVSIFRYWPLLPGLSQISINMVEKMLIIKIPNSKCFQISLFFIEIREIRSKPRKGWKVIDYK